MGLDLALLVVVGINAVVGLFRGVFTQILNLTALVASIFLADPVRDWALPHVHPYFQAIAEPTFAKVLWWVSALVIMWTINGLGSWLGHLLFQTLPKTVGNPLERVNQGLGFCYGAAVGTLVTAILCAGLIRFEDMASRLPWVGDQLPESRAVELSRRFDPIGRLWNAPPILVLRDQIAANGFIDLGVAATPTEDQPHFGAADSQPPAHDEEAPERSGDSRSPLESNAPRDDADRIGTDDNADPAALPDDDAEWWWSILTPKRG